MNIAKEQEKWGKWKQKVDTHNKLLERLDRLGIGDFERNNFLDKYFKEMGGNDYQDYLYYGPTTMINKIDYFNIINSDQLFPGEIERQEYHNLAIPLRSEFKRAEYLLGKCIKCWWTNAEETILVIGFSYTAVDTYIIAAPTEAYPGGGKDVVVSLELRGALEEINKRGLA